jgi:outer membrane protein TolC
LLLGFSIPVPILNANRGGIAEARAKRELARAAAETTFEILAQELASAQAAHDAACSQRVSFESTIVPLLAEQSAELERIVELGDVDTFLLLETVTRTYDAKRRLLELRLAESSAAITISHLLGPDGSREPAPIADHTAKRGTP